MTAHNDRIRQAEHAAGVYDDLPWEVGDVAHDPWAEDIPDGTVLVGALGDVWQHSDQEWWLPGIEGSVTPTASDGPFEVVWLPKEDTHG